MTPSHAASSVHLHPALLVKIDQEDQRTCCPNLRDPEIEHENSQLRIKTSNVFRSLFSCHREHAEMRKIHLGETIKAFKEYLEPKHEKRSIELAQTLFVQLDTLESLRLSHVKGIIKLAGNLDRGYADIKKLVIWLNWHKVYQDLRKELPPATAAPLASLNLPRGSLKGPLSHAASEHALQVAMKDKSRKNAEFNFIFKIINDLPVKGVSKEVFKAIAQHVKSNHQSSTVRTTIEYIIVQKEILRELIQRGGEIVSPPTEPPITAALRTQIERYESARELTPAQLTQLLARKGFYMPANENLGI